MNVALIFIRDKRFFSRPSRKFMRRREKHPYPGGRIEALEDRIEQGKTTLAEIAEASEDAWASIKDGVKSAWDCLTRRA